MLHRNLRVERVLEAWRQERLTYFAYLPADVVWLVSQWTDPTVFASEMIWEKFAEYSITERSNDLEMTILADESMLVTDGMTIIYLDTKGQKKDLDGQWLHKTFTADPMRGVWYNQDALIQWDPQTEEVLATIPLPTDLANKQKLVKSANGYYLTTHHKIFLFDNDFQLIDETGDKPYRFDPNSPFLSPDHRSEFPRCLSPGWFNWQNQMTTFYVDDELYRMALPLSQHFPELLRRKEYHHISHWYNGLFHDLFSVDMEKIYYLHPGQVSPDDEEEDGEDEEDERDMRCQWVTELMTSCPHGVVFRQIQSRPNGHLVVIGLDWPARQIVVYRLY